MSIINKTPNIYHFVFGLRPQTEPFHLMHYLCLVSCLQVNQPEAVIFHYYHEPWGPWWNLIRPSLQLQKITPDNYISAYTYPDASFNQYRYAHLADVARLEIIIKYGGIYADIDTLFINPLPERFFEQPFVMGREKVDWHALAAKQTGGSVCNAWMMGQPEAAFAKHWLAHIYQSFDGSWSGHSTYLPYRLSQEHPDWIQLEPERSFFAFDWTKAGIRAIFNEPPQATDGIYSIHLWSHLWWERSRTDFSYFHAARLTPEYIRFANSFYALSARRFLPEEVPARRSQFVRQRCAAILENWRFDMERSLRKIAKIRR